MNGDVPVLRRATAADALPAAGVWLRSFAAALPTVRCAHGAADVRAWFAQVLIPQYETWVAESGDEVVGLLVLKDAEMKQLYLAPEQRGQGLGDRFMRLAKDRRPDGLTLWAFQVNGAARRFYERHGFVAVQMTDGSRNDEQEPDVRYVWRPGV